MIARFYKLRIVLSVAIAGLVLLAVASTTALHGYMFADYAKAEAERHLRTASDTALAEVKRYFQPAETVTRHILALRANQIIGVGTDLRQELFSDFLNTIEIVPSFSSHVYSAYMGLSDGSFVSLVRSTPAVQKMAGIESLANAAFVTLENDVSRSDGFHFWSYRNQEKWIRIARKGLQYDPRTRPWFQQAKASAYPVWTDVYPFTVEEGHGITLASRIAGPDGELAGVVGVDLRLEDLAQFINGLKVAETGFAFLAGPDGQLIAHAGLVDPRSADSAARMNLQDVHRPDLADLKLFNTLKAADGGLVEFFADNKTFVGLRRPVSNQFGLNAYLFIAAPLSDFNSTAYDALKYTLWITLVLAMLVLALGALIARAVATPVCAAAEAMKNVAELNLEHAPKISGSHLAEIDMLNSSVGVMHHAMGGLSKYLPRVLVRDFLRQGLPIDLGGERRDITVLMTDIAGFSSIMENEDGEDLIQGLGDYFDVISTTVDEHDGTVDKFIGDAVMAFWGAPKPNAQHAGSACDAVVAIAKRLDAFNANRKAQGKIPFPTRMALHSGEAFVGNIGGRDRFGYTALGDVVNTAARMEKLAKKFGVQAIASEETARRADSKYDFNSLGKVHLDGMTQKIEALELALVDATGGANAA